MSKVLIIYTGGTFGMVYDHDKQHLVPANLDNIMQSLPVLEQLGIGLGYHAFEKVIDSSNMKPHHWIELAKIIDENYLLYDGFVVLHGTDTMAYTASGVSFLLENLNKPVIFTGAQIPLGEVRNDARENLVTSIQIAAAKQNNASPMVQEVAIFFDDVLLRGNRAQKVESNQFDAFASENYPELAHSGIEITYNESALRRGVEVLPLIAHEKLEEQIGLIKLYPGITKEYLEMVFSMSAKGFVLETFGAGNAMTDEWFIKLLKKANANGKVVLSVSQCMGGIVMPDHYETGKHLVQAGVINGKDLTTEAAIAKMMFVLANMEEGQWKEKLQHPLKGEMK